MSDMALREELQRRIEKKRSEIALLEAQAKDARIYLQALEDTLKLLPRESDERGYQDTELRQGTSVFRAREALRSFGKPIHISELVKAIGKPDTAESRTALSGSIGSYVRKGQIFTRPAPNTFGLLEFAYHDRAPSGPPRNFGSDSMPEDSEATTSEAGITDDDVPF